MSEARYPSPLATGSAGRKGGKTAAMRRAVYEARDRGEHVHVASAKGTFCAAREPGDCTLPRWEGLAP